MLGKTKKTRPCPGGVRPIPNAQPGCVRGPVFRPIVAASVPLWCARPRAFCEHIRSDGNKSFCSCPHLAGANCLLPKCGQIESRPAQMMELRQETTLATVRLHWGIFIPVLLLAFCLILVTVLPFILVAQLMNAVSDMTAQFHPRPVDPGLSLNVAFGPGPGFRDCRRFAAGSVVCVFQVRSDIDESAVGFPHRILVEAFWRVAVGKCRIHLHFRTTYGAHVWLRDCNGYNRWRRKFSPVVYRRAAKLPFHAAKGRFERQKLDQPDPEATTIRIAVAR